MVQSLPDADILELYGEFEAQRKAARTKATGMYCNRWCGVCRSLPFRRPVPPKSARCTNPFRAWLPFPDTVPALRELQKRYRLVVISNIDDDLFAETRKHLAWNSMRDHGGTGEKLQAFHQQFPDGLTHACDYLRIDCCTPGRAFITMWYRRDRWGSRRCG
jgi:thiol-disulfide isomerase/thioredoxin